MESIELKAYAKINLGLDVIRKREDGYHEVSMIMQTVDLYDTLTFTRKEQDGIWIRTNREDIPTDEHNLVYRAIRLLKETYHITQGVEVSLVKRIPVAAGMAGGSTDCATALVGVSKLFGLSLTKQVLMELGVRLGADVPYCILQGTALSEGIGEVLTPLPAMPQCHILIAKPPIAVSTKYVYEHLDAQGVSEHPDIAGMCESIRAGNLDGIVARMANVLETVTIPAHPEIRRIKERMKENGAKEALMSGSGPTVFGIYEDPVCAQNAGKQIEQEQLANEVYVVTPYQPM